MTLCPETPLQNQRLRCSTSNFGGHKAVVRPVPIPNTAVKHSLADGSGCIASARVGCRQIFLKQARPPRGLACLIFASIPGDSMSCQEFSANLQLCLQPLGGDRES